MQEGRGNTQGGDGCGMAGVRKLRCSRGKVKARLAAARHEMRGHWGVSDKSLPLLAVGTQHSHGGEAVNQPH